VEKDPAFYVWQTENYKPSPISEFQKWVVEVYDIEFYLLVFFCQEIVYGCEPTVENTVLQFPNVIVHETGRLIQTLVKPTHQVSSSSRVGVTPGGATPMLS